MDSTSLAVIAAAGYAAKPLVDAAAETLRSLLGAPCRIAGNLIADQIYGWQWVNRIKWANKVQVILDRDGVPPVELPAGFLVPLLESVGNVDDDTLQDMFAELAASVVRGRTGPSPAFRKTLEELSPSEALLLRNAAQGGIRFEIPDISDEPCAMTEESGKLLERCGFTDESFLLALDHLANANLLSPEFTPTGDDDDDGVPKGAILTAKLTSWGRDFMKRCCPELSALDHDVDFSWIHRQHVREMARIILFRE